MSEFDDLLDGTQAAQYLAERWGIASYSVAAWRMLRYRYHIKPAFSSRNSTFWRKSDLDKIPQPNRHNPRPKRARKKAEDVARDLQGVA